MDSFGPLVDADWLEANQDQVRIFDSRKYLDGRSGREEFERGHIAGAVFVDLDADLAAPAAAPGERGGRHPFPTAADFAASMGRLGYDGSVPAVIYDDVGGGMAGRMWFMLRLLDIPSAVLDGGIQAWNGGVEEGSVAVAPAVFAERTWPADRLVEADEVVSRIDAGGAVIDARNASRYAGKENVIDDRFGHIPGAINLAWEDNIDDLTGTMLDLDGLSERFGAVVASVEAGGQTPIAYCGSGVTACHDLMALELLGIEADLYVGSWSEWGSNESRPLETGDS
ncbi:MAG: sulfurtransferase [Actinomycetota bacterium]